MPVLLFHCCTISLLIAMHHNPLIWSVAKFLKIMSWFM
jgi:hypothetical protein